MQHCAIFRNRNNAKGWEPKNTGREPGLKGTGSGRFKPPCPPPPGNVAVKFVLTMGFHIFLALQEYRCNFFLSSIVIFQRFLFEF